MNEKRGEHRCTRLLTVRALDWGNERKLEQFPLIAV